MEATEEYFEDEDAVGRWLEERCLIDPNAKAPVSDLFADWKQWAERAGEFVGSIKRFSEQLINREFEKCRLHGGSRALPA